jgi:hypothetical protein
MAKQKQAWHNVVQLRDDLRSGELPMHMFAADLYEVLMQGGKRSVYEKPENFFALTFPTVNLRRLVRDVVLRLAGKNDKAVRQLELTYGGGKTHTLITLFHLVNDPERLPNLPAVGEFTTEIGQQPPQCRIAGLCFDKLDVEKGMEVCAPNGKKRMLKQPWSVLAYQLAGDAGLKLLHAENKAAERDSAPAENLLTELLELPGKDGLGTLILIDEVLMYAREKVEQDKSFRGKLVNFFQYLTQAVAKVDRCCLVASLLASDPKKNDTFGREIQGEFYNIFGRQREEAIEPVVKEDVAEVLRRRFFTPESLQDQKSFRQHVIAAVKGIATVDEATEKHQVEAEERFLNSFPFHPDLTEVLYSKWTQLASFQRTRGVLRTFALALREAAKWDTAPLIGPAVFLTENGTGLSEALREMVTIADSDESEGKKQAWAGILDNEFKIAREVQNESVGLDSREIEQAVVVTFLHSQPVGQDAKVRELFVLLGVSSPDKIDLEKGLVRWAQSSHWLDDQFIDSIDRLPGTWRLGNRPNLTQMHAVAMRNIPDGTVRARLMDDIGKQKNLTSNATAAGARTHLLPQFPKDVPDDGKFSYVVLGPSAASESNKPSEEARRYIEETTGPDRPRVNKNAILLLTPSNDGLENALTSVRRYLAWEAVHDEIKKQQKDGHVDPVRAQTLSSNISTTKGKISDAIRQAYSVVVTLSESGTIEAFRITVTDEPHFNIIKSERRSRIQDTAITAEALLPSGPYDLWREGETSRLVSHLTSVFAQVPHLPKMLKTSAIHDTVARGCEQGCFMLRLLRPDRTYRTWWFNRPDAELLDDPSMELVLANSAILMEIASDLLVPGVLPSLWAGDEIRVNDVYDYFSGNNVVQIAREGYSESMPVPKAEKSTVDRVIETATMEGKVWLISGSASIFGESVPDGIIQPDATLRTPPTPILPAAILPENLTDAWQDIESDIKQATGLSISIALSSQLGQHLPWKIVNNAINGALRAGFVELTSGSQPLPCEFSSAQYVILKTVSGVVAPVPVSGVGKILTAESELDMAQVQELGDIVAKLSEIKTRHNVPIRYFVRIEVGDVETPPSSDVIQKCNALLKKVKDGFHVG